MEGDFWTIGNFWTQPQLSLSSSSFINTGTALESSKVGYGYMHLP